MFRGLTTMNLAADDVDAAATWYADLLGVQPYFRRETPDGRAAYVEFRLGDRQDELGIISTRFAGPGSGTGRALTHWVVDDLDAVYRRLLDKGATAYLAPREHAPGFVTASVVDPFGDLFAVMTNQHWHDMLAAG